MMKTPSDIAVPCSAFSKFTCNKSVFLPLSKAKVVVMLLLLVAQLIGTCEGVCENPAGEFDNDSLRAAVDLFDANPAEAEAQFGSIDTWCTSEVTNMADLFNNKRNFNAPIGTWDVSSVTNMLRMFSNARSFNQDISSWNVSKVRNMIAMFNVALSFDQDISSWDVSQALSMASMFRNARAFNQDISSWNVSNVRSMRSMFNIALSFNQNIRNWDVSSVTDMRDMFLRAGAFNQDLCSWEAKTDGTLQLATGMFSDSGCAVQENPLDTDNWCVLCAGVL